MINRRRSKKYTNKFPNMRLIFLMDDSLLEKSSCNYLKESLALDLNVFSKRLAYLRIENCIFDEKYFIVHYCLFILFNKSFNKRLLLQ